MFSACGGELLLSGLSFHSAPIGLRENLARLLEGNKEFVQCVSSLPNVNGTIVVNTCNRFELLTSVSARASAKAKESIWRYLLSNSALGLSEISSDIYSYENERGAGAYFSRGLGSGEHGCG